MIHDLKVVPFLLYQKVKLEVKRTIVILKASHPKTKIAEKALILTEHDDDDEDLWGFNAKG